MKKFINIITLFFALCFMWSCLDEPTVYPLEVTTDDNVEFIQGGVKLRGTISSNGSRCTVDRSGFCYSLTPNPTILNRVYVTKSSGNTGVITGEITNVLESTTYYVRAFAQNITGVVYGEEIKFTTKTRPVVKTLSVTEVTSDYVVVESDLVSEGSGVDMLGLCYSTTRNPVYSTTNFVQAYKTAKGKYSIKISDLDPNTKYWVRAYAKNVAGEFYGESLEVKTMSAPNVTTNKVEIIDINNVKLKATIDYDGTCVLTERGFCIGTSSWRLDVYSSTIIRCGNGVGDYETIFSEISVGTTYYVCAYAKYDNDLVRYGQILQFKALTLPEVETNQVKKISKQSVECSGTITTLDNPVELLERGICYSTSSEPTIDDIVVKSNSTSGKVTCTLNNLEYDITYYVRAYAKHEYGVVYGNEVNFILDEPKSNKLYFVNYLDWSTVYAYVWPDNGSGIVVWPGEEATLEDIKFKDFEVWSYDVFVDEVDNIIFNSGSGSQTDDLVIDLSKPYFYSGEWYASLDDIVITFHNGYEYVDLGLSSGTKWATMNVGADSPEDYGYYFAWGETTTKSTYNWSTYKWCNGSMYSQTKYCTKSSYGKVDNKTILELSDDAANANWGGDWRMPTIEELDELRTGCTWAWTRQNGVNGYKVTSKTNGNSIFLPAAGYRYGSYLYDVGYDGFYWSSSLYTSASSGAYSFIFSSGSVNWSGIDRCYSRSVRPVMR